MIKIVKIQEKRLKHNTKEGNYRKVLYVIVPHSLAKKRGFSKGNEVIFLEPEELAKIENGDLILRQKQKTLKEAVK